MESLGHRIRTARVANGLTQVALARDIMSPSHLSLVERDLRRPSPRSLSALADRLGLSTAELVQHPSETGRPAQESRLIVARRAYLQRRFAVAERAATQVLQRQASLLRRQEAFELRAATRSALGRRADALRDLDDAIEIARRRQDSRAVAAIWFDALRLRREDERNGAA